MDGTTLMFNFKTLEFNCLCMINKPFTYKCPLCANKRKIKINVTDKQYQIVIDISRIFEITNLSSINFILRNDSDDLFYFQLEKENSYLYKIITDEDLYNLGLVSKTINDPNRYMLIIGTNNSIFTPSFINTDSFKSNNLFFDLNIYHDYITPLKIDIGNIEVVSDFNEFFKHIKTKFKLEDIFYIYEGYCYPSQRFNNK